MAWLIGADEAGYGPNLGPMVVAATAWRVSDQVDLDAVDLYHLLRDAVARAADPSRIAIADSKELYKPRGGLGLLEAGVHAALGCRASCEGYRSLVAELGADPVEQLDAAPWREGWDAELPIDAPLDSVDRQAKQLLACCKAAGVDSPVLRARLVFPKEFNTLVERYRTKGAALSHVTLALVQSLLSDAARRSPDEPIRCVLDKHGGRNRYAALLQHHFPEQWIDTLEESRAVSRYRSGAMSFAFQTRGEQFMPAALASMSAKYLRELAMRGFNEYWARQVPGIKPTAGYPTDARRFWREIKAMQGRLGIEDSILWRQR